MKPLLTLWILALAVALTCANLPAHAQSTTTMVCQTQSGVQFVWVGTACPVGSYFVSY